MRLLFAFDVRYDRTPDGAIWSNGAFAYHYWSRFFDIFDSVQVLGRVRDVQSAAPEMLRVDGPGVSVAPIPYYLGPLQFLRKARRVWKAARDAFAYGDAVLLYAGGPVSHALAGKLGRMGYPFAVHVGADPYDLFAPGSIKHPLRPFLRWFSPRYMRYLCSRAAAGVYVTQQALQKRYPCPGFTTGITDVELPPEAWVSAPRPQSSSGSFRLITVGTLQQLYKAPDVLIDAVAECVRGGLDLRLVLVGDGRHRPELEARARERGIADRVEFRGHLVSGKAVRDELDTADLFVLASYQEGLPRAMVEAMARALPCIGSTVGGIPELLPPEDMVSAGDATALARKIREVVTDTERMARMSARNLKVAGNYSEDVLRQKRLEFWRHIEQMTREWLEQHGAERRTLERKEATR